VNACEITPCEMPALAASCDIAATNALKSPPQRAAKAGPVVISEAKKMARQNLRMRILEEGSLSRSCHER
jgi:hypothetical protein